MVGWIYVGGYTMIDTHAMTHLWNGPQYPTFDTVLPPFFHHPPPTGAMYNTLRSEVQDIASNDPLTAEEVQSLPRNIHAYLLNMQLQLREKGVEEEEEEDVEEEEEVDEEERRKRLLALAGYTEEGRPVDYVSPLEEEERVFTDNAAQCEISRRYGGRC
jgi:hypothetical protein